VTTSAVTAASWAIRLVSAAIISGKKLTWCRRRRRCTRCATYDATVPDGHDATAHRRARVAERGACKGAAWQRTGANGRQDVSWYLDPIT
jgi:hypothetical protein